MHNLSASCSLRPKTSNRELGISISSVCGGIVDFALSVVSETVNIDENSVLVRSTSLAIAMYDAKPDAISTSSSLNLPPLTDFDLLISSRTWIMPSLIDRTGTERTDFTFENDGVDELRFVDEFRLMRLEKFCELDKPKFISSSGDCRLKYRQ